MCLDTVSPVSLGVSHVTSECWTVGLTAVRILRVDWEGDQYIVINTSDPLMELTGLLHTSRLVENFFNSSHE